MDVILCLGGNTSRLYAAIDLFKKHPNSKIVVSSEGNPDLVVSLLDRAGVPRNQFILDFQAWDTVTNFTKTKKLVLSYKPRALCIVTDKFHMRRSMAIAQAVYWLNDIQLVPIPYMGSEPHPPEDKWLVRTDRLRAWLWRLTGYLYFYPKVKKQRMPDYEAELKYSIRNGYPVNRDV
jgi:uncharacterized SAM-binding protein YcdF (DUF218 family)